MSAITHTAVLRALQFNKIPRSKIYSNGQGGLGINSSCSHNGRGQLDGTKRIFLKTASGASGASPAPLLT